MAIAALEHRDAGKALRRLATPNALALVADQLLSIVDTIAIGALGTAPLASITAATGIFVLVGIPLFAFGTGLRIVGAQAIGAGASERFGAIVRAATVVPLAIATAFALASLAASRPLLAHMLPAGAPVDAAAHYLVLRCFCLPLMTCSGTLIMAFATAGDARLGLRVLVAISAVHLPLVFVLALGKLTGHPLGLTGAGISSLVAELSGFAYAVHATARRPELRVFASWRVERALVRRTTALSWPEFVFLVLQMVPEPVTIALLAPAGTSAVGAYRALALVNDVTWALPGGLGDASEVVLGQRIGARDYAGANAFRVAATRIAVASCGGVGIAVAAAAWPLAALCTLSPALATLAAAPLALHVGVTLPMKGYAMTTIAPIRAAGDTRFVMVMGILMSVVALGGIWLAVAVLHLGLWAYPCGWIAAWIVRGALTTLRLRSGDWRRRALVV